MFTDCRFRHEGAFILPVFTLKNAAGLFSAAGIKRHPLHKAELIRLRFGSRRPVETIIIAAEKTLVLGMFFIA